MWHGVWISSTVVLAALVFYRVLWRQRYGRPISLEGEAVRLRGRVLSVDPAREGDASAALVVTLEERGGSPTPIVALGEATAGLVPGGFVTVDALRTNRAVDGLPRQPGREPVLEAVRVVSGAWPELSWVPVLALGLAAIGPLPLWLSARRDDSFYEWTRSTLRCPEGSSVESGPRLPGGWVHFCRASSDGVRHGRFTVWSEKGILLESTTYRYGVKHGPASERERSGVLRRVAEFLDGKLDGSEVRFREDGTLLAERNHRKGHLEGRQLTFGRGREIIDRQTFKDRTEHGRFFMMERCAEARKDERFRDFLTNHRLIDLLQAFQADRERRLEIGEEPCPTESVRSGHGEWIEESFWGGLQVGPRRVWREGRLVEEGFVWGGQPYGMWRSSSAPGAPRAERFRLFKLTIEDPARALREDPRLGELFSAVARQQAAAVAALEEWERWLDSPTSEPAEEPAFSCRRGCDGEGCRDARGRQGVWVFPHDWSGGFVLYVDGTPRLRCRFDAPEGSPLADACTWLDMPHDGSKPKWWSRVPCLPGLALEELGVLALQKAAEVGPWTPRSYAAGVCEHLGIVPPGLGGLVDVRVGLEDSAGVPGREIIELRRRIAALYAGAIARAPSLARAVELDLAIGQDGGVIVEEISSTGAGTALTPRIVEAVRASRIRPAPGAKAARVSLKLSIERRSGDLAAPHPRG
jgi:hypothetical protein